MKKMRRILVFSILVILLTVIFTGCSQAKTTEVAISPATITQSTGVPTIAVADADKLIQANKNNSGFVLLDVRTPDEFNGGHIAGAIDIDYYAADFKANIGKLDKNKQYLVYCRTGIRGAASVQIMIDLGFTRTQNMAGGITEWMQEGYPTVK